MEELKTRVDKIISLMGVDEFKVDADGITRRISIIINDRAVTKDDLPSFVLNIERIVRLIAKQLNGGPVIVDVNNYRKEREALIVKLARAAARKAVATNEEVSLPPMNAYERRLVHTELSIRPDVETESFGENRERHVVIKPATY
jgi:predicted RNA-binding protein Jag